MSNMKNKQPTKVLIEYEDGDSIELTRDVFESNVDVREELVSVLFMELSGSMPVVRRLLGIPKGFKISRAIRILQEEGREALDKVLENFTPAAHPGEV